MDSALKESSTGYTIRLDNFEGPLDLLLFLIREQEIDIYDIPIAAITKQYLEFIDLMQILDLEVAGEYLVMAATLLRIKSKMLLPQEAAEEEGETEDPRQELVRQLLEYQRYKEVVTALSEREENQRLVYLRSTTPTEDEEETVEPLQKVTLFDLLKAFQVALQRRTEPSFYPIQKPMVSVEHRMEEILERLRLEGKVLFQDLFAKDFSRAAIVVSFIAILEMIRRRVATVRQKGLFGEIWIFRQTGNERDAAHETDH